MELDFLHNLLCILMFLEWTLGALLTEMSKKTCAGPSMAASISGNTGGATKYSIQEMASLILTVVLMLVCH